MTDLPQVECTAHRIRTVRDPWTAPHVRCMTSFETYAIGLLKEMTYRQRPIRWKKLDCDGRGYATPGEAGACTEKRNSTSPHIGVGESSFRKRHDYVTIIPDSETSIVLCVGKDRQESVERVGTTRLYQHSWMELNGNYNSNYN